MMTQMLCARGADHWHTSGFFEENREIMIYLACQWIKNAIFAPPYDVLRDLRHGSLQTKPSKPI